MTETALFTVDGKRGTKQYGVAQLADEENENLAKSLLIEKAKGDAMVEWCFLPNRKEYNMNDGREYTYFSMLANPFHSEKPSNNTGESNV